MFPEILYATFKIFSRNKQMFLDIFLLNMITGFTRENHQFTDHIHTTQINTWIRLCITCLFRHNNRTTHRNRLIHFVENVVQRSWNHRFDLDNRQTCTHIGFKEEFYTSRPRNVLQFEIMIIFRRGCNLIGSNNRNIMRQQIFINAGYRRAGRAINKYGIKDIHRQYLIPEPFWCRNQCRCRQLLFIGS